MLQRVYVLRCLGCEDPILLPHQSPIEKFGGLPRLATDILPLRYWCQHCGRVSSFQAEDSRLEGVEVQGQSPYTERLWGIEFECVLEGSERHFSIYAKNLRVSMTDDEVKQAIAASGACGDSPQSVKILRTYGFQAR
jgi:hypothetical protein